MSATTSVPAQDPIPARTSTSHPAELRPEPGFLQPLAECLGRHANAATVFGEPVERGEVTVIPVARAKWGVGGGSGSGPQESQAGSGGGGGLMVHPVGYIEIARGRTRFRPIRGPLSTATWLLAAGSLSILALRAWKGRTGNDDTRGDARR